MTPLKKTILISLSLWLFSSQVIAIEKQQITFKKVMQGLLVDTQNITKGIVLTDFTLIEKSAKKIVDHPKPDLAIRMKIVKALGSDMGKFKAKDNVVHKSAVNLLKAAKLKNMEAVTQEYQALINGCLGCHSQFKDKVAAALK